METPTSPKSIAVSPSGAYPHTPEVQGGGTHNGGTPSGGTRFVRLPIPLNRRVPADAALLGRMLLWGIHIARPAQAFDSIRDRYAHFEVKNTRILPGAAWPELDDAVKRFGHPIQLVISAALHFSLFDSRSPFHDPGLINDIDPDRQDKAPDGSEAPGRTGDRTLLDPAAE